MLDCLDKVREACSDEDILVLHGGGNFGNQYMYIEESRRKIFEKKGQKNKNSSIHSQNKMLQY